FGSMSISRTRLRPRGRRKKTMNSILKSSRSQALIYWIPTVLVALGAAAGGLADVSGDGSAREVLAHLGYPAYFGALLGVAKLLGALALVVPVPRTVREWAYAGLTFDVIAAAVSILAVGDPPSGIAIPLAVCALTQLSAVAWRRRARRPVV